MTMLLLGDALMTLREALYGYKYVFERLSAGVIEGIKGIIFVFSVSDPPAGTWAGQWHSRGQSTSPPNKGDGISRY